MRRLFYLGVFVTLLIGADVAARGFVESAVNARAQQEAPPGTTVSASVGGFPFLPGLVFGTTVSKASVRIENLETDVLVFADIEIDLHGLHLDRGRLINDRKARITSIDRGTVTATVTEQALSTALPVTVTMADGKITANVAGSEVVVTPSVKAGRLVLTGPGGNSFDLKMPTTDFLPCIGDVTVEEGRLRFSCEIHEVPPALLDAVQN